MFQRLGSKRDQLADLERIEELVRNHFKLDPADLVLPALESSRVPGMPQNETVVRFWKGAQRYRLRLFKPLPEVSLSDLPAAWLLPSLIDDGDPDCC